MASAKDNHTLKKRRPRFFFYAFITEYSKANLVTCSQRIHLMTCFCSMKNNLLGVFIVQIINRYCIGITIITINRQNATSRTTKQFFRRVYTDFIFLLSNWSEHVFPPQLQVCRSFHISLQTAAQQQAQQLISLCLFAALQPPEQMAGGLTKYREWCSQK